MDQYSDENKKIDESVSNNCDDSQDLDEKSDCTLLYGALAYLLFLLWL